MSTPSLNDLIELGAVSEAQGLQGQVKVASMLRRTDLNDYAHAS